MTDVPAAFAISADDLAVVLASLEAEGFVASGPVATIVTVLDTFDRRLHRTGRHIVADSTASSTELVLLGAHGVVAHESVTELPRFVRDLPDGPVRSAVEQAVGLRALLPLVSVETERTRLVRTSGKGTVTAEFTLSAAPRLPGRPDVPLPQHLLELTYASTQKHARNAASLAEADGGVRVGRDLVQIVGAAAQVSFSAPTAPRFDLDPDAPAVEAFRRALAALAWAIELNAQGAAEDIDPEFLHDLRIAVRKTRTVLTQGRSVLPDGFVDEVAPEFRWLGTLTGPARDLDVQLLGWPALVAGLGADAEALDPLRSLLGRRRAEAHRALAEGLMSERAQALLTSWHERLDAIEGDLTGRHASVPTATFVRRRIVRSHRRLVDNGRLVTDESPAQALHDLRKDAKRVRYLFESFAPMLPDKPTRAFVRELRGLQENLGVHQDAEVQETRLRQLAIDLSSSGAPPETVLAIGRLVEQLDQRRLAARRDFATRFSAFDAAPTRRALRAALEELED